MKYENDMNIEEFNKKLVINTDGRCDCGKYEYKNGRYLGIICDRCGTEVGRSRRIYFDKEEFFGAFNHRQIVKYPKNSS